MAYEEALRLIGECFEGNATKVKFWLENPHPQLSGLKPMEYAQRHGEEKFLMFVKGLLEPIGLEPRTRPMPKLVRDNIGRHPLPGQRIHRAHPEELDELLIDKLHEEVAELAHAQTREHALEELADIYEVLIKIVKVKKLSMDEVILTAANKARDKGRFDQHFILMNSD